MVNLLLKLRNRFLLIKLSNFKKLFKTPLTLSSLFYILMLFSVAIFAYQITPDNSTNANRMHLSIHSKSPGFKTKMVIIDESSEIELNDSFFWGSKKKIKEIPIQDYYFEDSIVKIKPYHSPKDYFETLDYKKIKSKNFEREFLIEKKFYLGTDKYGRDLLSRLILGTRISFSIGLLSVIISLILGITIGLIGGYFGGIIDKLIIWIINIFWAIPTLLMVLAITLALGRGLWQIFIAVGLTMWIEVARIVRGQVLSIKEKSFIESAVILGLSKFRILIVHIIPLIVPQLIVISASNFASAILIESGLSFLGIGVQPPVPSWGIMVKDHFRYLLLGKPYLTLLPGFAIMSLVMAFMILGSGLRDLLDVRN